MPGHISSPNPGSGSDGCFATLSDILDEEWGVEGQWDKKHLTPQGDPPSVGPNGGGCTCGVRFCGGQRNKLPIPSDNIDRDGYTLRATEVSNTTLELAVSPPFPIGAAEVSPPLTVSSPTTGSLSGTGSGTAAQGGPTNSNAGMRVGLRGSGWAMVAAVMGAVDGF